MSSKAVLVTGTSTGLGRAVAIFLARSGFRVFASVRKESDADDIKSQGSERLTPVLIDVTDEASISCAREEIEEKTGRAGLWGLVNNAGYAFWAPLEFVPLDEMRKLYDVNVIGTLAVTQAFLPLLRKAHGRILNISSIASLVMTPYHGPYSTSKVSVNGLTQVLRMEVKSQGVQVSLLIYGGVITPIWDKSGEYTKRVEQRYPLEYQELYQKSQDKAFEYFYQSGIQGLLPEIAARPILHALCAKRPKNTYFVGPKTQFYNLLDKLLYGRLREWVIERTMGL